MRTDTPAAATERLAVALGKPPRRLRIAFMLPAIGFAGLVVAFAIGLGRDPRLVPSPLIGKPVPRFSLPPVKGRTLGLSSGDLYGKAFPILARIG